MESVIRMFPINMSKYVPFIKEIDDERKRLRQYRRDCNKFKQNCYDNDAMYKIRANEKAMQNITNDISAQYDRKIKEVKKDKNKIIAEQNAAIEEETCLMSYFNGILQRSGYNDGFTRNVPVCVAYQCDMYGNIIGPFTATSTPEGHR